uniref:Serpentine receptor class gamma n=1 Tax=Parastrongyloides trichosuri TaxID=131310 RepID=A0A0N5A2U3_PARTI
MSKTLNENTKNGKSLNYQMELRFFLSASISFFAQLIVAIQNLIVNQMTINKEYKAIYVMTLIFPLLNDIIVFPNIWFLIFISSVLQKSLREYFCGSNKESTTHVKAINRKYKRIIR